jgi:hypothetical protein
MFLLSGMKAVLLFLVLVVVVYADASSDTSDSAKPWVDREGPRVETLEVSHQEVDVTNGSSTVYVTVRVTDDLSGVGWGLVEFRSPTYFDSEGADGQGASADAYYDQIKEFLIEGDELDGVYRIPLTIPQFAEPGEWRMVGCLFGDNVGNTSQQYQTDIGEFEGVILRVRCDTPDVEPPVISNFTITTQSIDVTEGSINLEVTLTVTDDRSGLASIYFDLEHESGQRIYPEGFDASEVRTGGSATDGTYGISIPISEFAAPGSWTIQSIGLADNAGNHWYVADFMLLEYFEQKEFPTTFTVTSINSDTTPPVLHSVAIEPPVVDVTHGSATVRVILEATDDLSGIIGGEVLFKSPSGFYSANAEIDALVRAGNIVDDTYELELQIPQFTEVGDWMFHYLILRDAMENSFVLYVADESEPTSESLEDYFDRKAFPRSLEVTATRISLRGLGRFDVMDNPLGYGLVKLSDVSDAGGDRAALSEVFGRPLEEFNLFTADSILDLNMGGVIVQKHGTGSGATATVTLHLQQSLDLNIGWTPLDTLEYSVEGVPDDKWFIRVRALGPQ